MDRWDRLPAAGGRRASLLRISTGLVALTGVLAVWATGVAQVGAASPSPIATVVQVPDPGDLRPCAPLRTGLRYEVDDTDESFTLRVRAATTPCSPIAAAAAVYRMPTMGSWPQRLVERTDFVIDGPGTTEIRFTKGCEPLQFDVVTGSTPETIAPWGAWHGPLLFLGDVATAKQHRPAAGCGAPATTAPPTTVPTDGSVTTVPTDGTTTVPPSVSGTVTTTSEPAPAAPTTPSGAPVDVLGRSQVPDPGPALDTSEGTPPTPTVAGLALTGASSRILVVAGLAAIVVGLAMSIAARRRSA